MSEFISVCDDCLFNPHCMNIGTESCKTLCTDINNPLYQAYMIGFNAGFDTAESEYNDEIMDDEEDEEWEEE